jgi:hypothetical protein
MLDLLVSVPADAPFSRRAEPVRVGVPFAEGALPSDRALVLRAPGGSPVALQTRVLDRWTDGSCRWVLLDFLADHDGGERPATYRLDAAPGQPPPAAPRVVASAVSDGVLVETGSLSCTVASSGEALFRRLLVGGTDVVDVSRTALSVEAEDGLYVYAATGADVEESGPVRAIVRVDGAARSAAGRIVHVMTRLHFFAGLRTVKVEIALHNPERAVHPGGIWELGEATSIQLRDVALTIALATTSPERNAAVLCSPEAGRGFDVRASMLELFQASSGGEYWQSLNHVDRHGNVPLAFKGYSLRAGAEERRGVRATPIVTAGSGPLAVAVAVPQFWQNFPKAIEATSRSIVFRLFPRQQASPHELQPGERKTHVIYVAFGADDVAAEPLAWSRAPVFARTTPEQYCGSGVIPYLQPLTDEPDATYAALVSEALEGGDSFLAKRERIDEYGWRNYGDLYADHERVYYRGQLPVHSHYNNQYDAIAGFARQFARSGDVRWWTQLCELATHVADIDIYHTDLDKAAYNRGLFWHTGHYVDAGRSSHRSYPRADGVSGGGPASEHNYATGLCLYYYMSGDVAARDAAIGLARWVVAMDDGRKTIFRWLSRGDTGVASSTFDPSYNGPGRGAGHSIAALLDGYRLTDDRMLLDKAETLIRRCVHPADDIAALRLLRIEERWSYTIFLHVLGRYLDEKVLRRELDEMFAYARQALLAYARWMAEHESPYLHRRAELEYPTETWDAQELWKSEVFSYAARYAEPSERPRFLERADYFFRYAVDALAAAPTRTLTRPMVLMMSRGLMHGYFERHAEALDAPRPAAVNFARPSRAFEPQKIRAKRHAMMAAGGAAGAAVMAVLLWLL